MADNVQTEAQAATDYDNAHGATIAKLAFGEGKASGKLLAYLRDNPPRTKGERTAARDAYCIGQIAADSANGATLTAKMREDARKIVDAPGATSKDPERRTQAQETAVKRYMRAFDRACERAGITVKSAQGGANNAGKPKTPDAGATDATDAADAYKETVGKELRKHVSANNEPDALARMAAMAADMAAFIDAQKKSFTNVKAFKDQVTELRTNIAKMRNETE